MKKNNQKYIIGLNELATRLTSPAALEAIDFLLEEIATLDCEKEIEDAEPREEIFQSDQAFGLPRELKGRENFYALFSDGACRGNPGPGSWGVMAQNSTGKILFEAVGVKVLTTNNQMELEGAIQGLIKIQKEKEWIGREEHSIYLYSDSKYVVDGITKWAPKWKARGWKKANKLPPENLAQWQHLDKIVGQFKFVKFIWIKGHAGHPQNERVDGLANQALDRAGF